MVLTTFTSGTTAVASEVNANFTELETDIATNRGLLALRMLYIFEDTNVHFTLSHLVDVFMHVKTTKSTQTSSGTVGLATGVPEVDIEHVRANMNSWRYHLRAPMWLGTLNGEQLLQLNRTSNDEKTNFWLMTDTNTYDKTTTDALNIRFDGADLTTDPTTNYAAWGTEYDSTNYNKIDAEDANTVNHGGINYTIVRVPIQKPGLADYYTFLSLSFAINNFGDNRSPTGTLRVRHWDDNAEAWTEAFDISYSATKDSAPGTTSNFRPKAGDFKLRICSMPVLNTNSSDGFHYIKFDNVGTLEDEFGNSTFLYNYFFWKEGILVN